LNSETLFELVKQKKSKVGGGFLNNQGALFLVAADLGVALKPISNPKEEMQKKNGEDPNDLPILARILTIGSPKTITRRVDSNAGFLGKIVLYDAVSTSTVSVWGKDVFFRILQSNFAPGDIVKVAGLVRSSSESFTPSFSLNDDGALERMKEDENSERTIPSISQRSLDASEINSLPLGAPSIVKGKIAGSVKTSEFTRKDRTHGRYVSFGIVSAKVQENGGNNVSEVRVVIWDNSNPTFDKLQPGEIVTLLNVKTKESDFTGTKVLELHGDETTHILEHWDQSRIWLESQHFSVLKKLPPLDSTKPVGLGEAQQRTSAFVARVLSTGMESAITDNASAAAFHLLVVDSSKRKISVTALGESSRDATALQIDDVILCKPESFDQTGLRITCSRKGSLYKVKPERNDIPKSSTLVTSIESLEPNSISSVDCMILSVSPSRDIQTKEGLVKRSEAIVADPTGEIKLYAWRGLAKQLEPLSAGTRLMLRGVEVQSHEGKKFLVFKNYTGIEIISS
jgi:hypothetical protein